MLQIGNIDGDKVHVITASGRLDATSAPEMEQNLLATLSAGNNFIVIDLSQLEYISSAGLRVLLLGAKKTKEGSGKLLVCGMSGMVAEVFKMSGFNQVIDAFPSQKEAMAAM